MRPTFFEQPPPLMRLQPGAPLPLFDRAANRRIEQEAAHRLPPHELMRRAGTAAACLARALRPHGRRVWAACGYGNNAGDGLYAAALLQRWGWEVHLTLLTPPQSLPADAQWAWAQCQQAGCVSADAPPAQADLALDALLGAGAAPREPQGMLLQHVQTLNRLRPQGCCVLAVDLPTGLDCDTGAACTAHVQADHTLQLLALKPGCFTGMGREVCGENWWSDLGLELAEGNTPPSVEPLARLLPPPPERHRPHHSHKGTWGDVWVLGGAEGMLGAPILAATSALFSRAGRVFLSFLSARGPGWLPPCPEVMIRPWEGPPRRPAVLVAGCGGGPDIAALLPELLQAPHPLVLDADALNALSASAPLQAELQRRAARGWISVLTPHPLEAARLLGTEVAVVQADRIRAAGSLARQLGCWLVLKGSGTVIAHAEYGIHLNPTGDARLAVAGTGDVLAGMIGAALASGLPTPAAIGAAVFRHGALADDWPQTVPWSAGALARAAQPF